MSFKYGILKVPFETKLKQQNAQVTKVKYKKATARLKIVRCTQTIYKS